MTSLILLNIPSLIPLTFIISSGFLYGRPSMIACAFTGPISGKASICSLVAVLMFTFCPGASLAGAEVAALGLPFSAIGAAAAFVLVADFAGAGATAGLISAAGLAGAESVPTLTRGFRDSMVFLETPAFL